MKILSFNTGYFLGYSGTHTEYLKNPLKGIRGSRNEKDNLDRFIDIVNSEEPEIVLLQEVDGGSMRSFTGGQHNYISEKLGDEYSSNFNSKYRGNIFPTLPIFRFMGNMVLFKDGEAENHKLEHGRKSLVQEIKMKDFSIFSLHLSTFGGWIRKRQLEEIRGIAEKRENYLLAGDLNFHKGRKEVNHLEKLLEQKVLSPGNTFPSVNPEQKLDLVTASEGLKIENLKEIGDRFSDHRPIVFDIEKI